MLYMDSAKRAATNKKGNQANEYCTPDQSPRRLENFDCPWRPAASGKHHHGNDIPAKARRKAIRAVRRRQTVELHLNQNGRRKPATNKKREQAMSLISEKLLEQARAKAATAKKNGTHAVNGKKYFLEFCPRNWYYTVTDETGEWVVNINSKQLPEAKRFLTKWVSE